MASTRRLAAILAADVVGYSRLMRADEEGTHERFKAHRRELVDPKIREHHGRVVKYTGDGMLAEEVRVEHTDGVDRRPSGLKSVRPTGDVSLPVVMRFASSYMRTM